MSKRTSGRSGISNVERSHLPLTIKQVRDEYFYRIDLDADYQREKVWSKTDQELLLDSIIKGIDIPKLYLAGLRGNKQFDFECIDGKQRLLAIAGFVDPKKTDTTPLSVDILHKKYTFEKLSSELPQLAESFLKYRLDFVVYDEATLSEAFLREIFRRLQLGLRLNSGEILNSQLGAMRDFVFKEMGKDGPFLRNTKLSDKRFSRQFTLAQICINSFTRKKHGAFVRARLSDLEDFFAEHQHLPHDNENFRRIRKVLKVMDREFGSKAEAVSSRAIAVSAYLFVEHLLQTRKSSQVKAFVKFYIKLLAAVREDMELISRYEKPKNTRVLDEFQKYVLQASVEPYAIKRRDEFIRKSFEYFRASRTRGRLLGS